MNQISLNLIRVLGERHEMKEKLRAKVKASVILLHLMLSKINLIEEKLICQSSISKNLSHHKLVGVKHLQIRMKEEKRVSLK